MPSGPSPILMTNPQQGDVYIFSVSTGRGINTTLNGAGIASLSAFNSLNSTVSGIVSSLSSFATQTYVNQQITTAIASIPSVDLTNYATKNYVDNSIAAIPSTDLTPYATKNYVTTQIANIPPTDLSSYATKTYSDNAVQTFANTLGTASTYNVGTSSNQLFTLDNNAKVPVSLLPSTVVGGLNYQGTWNANTNIPNIGTASSNNKGYFWKISTAGSTNKDGIIDWKIGDWIVSNGTTWDKVDNTDQVSSVAGKTGIITLDASDIISGIFPTSRLPTTLTGEPNKLALVNPDGLLIGNFSDPGNAVYINGDGVDTAWINQDSGQDLRIGGNTRIDENLTLRKALVFYDNTNDDYVNITFDDNQLTSLDTNLQFNNANLKSLSSDNDLNINTNFTVQSNFILNITDQISFNTSTYSGGLFNISGGSVALGDILNNVNKTRLIVADDNLSIDLYAQVTSFRSLDYPDSILTVTNGQITIGDYNNNINNTYINVNDIDKSIYIYAEDLFINNSQGFIEVRGYSGSRVNDPFSGSLLEIVNVGYANNHYASLDGSGKVQTSQLPSTVLGGLNYQGTWNANTNTPNFGTASSAGKGSFWKVSTAGTTNKDGITDWQPGDWIVSNGTIFDKIDNTDQVLTVAGRQGAIILTAADIGAGIFPGASYNFTGISVGTTGISSSGPVSGTTGTFSSDISTRTNFNFIATTTGTGAQDVSAVVINSSLNPTANATYRGILSISVRDFNGLKTVMTATSDGTNPSINFPINPAAGNVTIGQNVLSYYGIIAGNNGFYGNLSGVNGASIDLNPQNFSGAGHNHVNIARATLTATSGTMVASSTRPTMATSGTAGWTAHEISVTQTSDVGTGTKRLIDAKVGGTSMFWVGIAGDAYVTAPAAGDSSTRVVTSAWVQGTLFDVTQFDLTDSSYRYYGGNFRSGPWQINRWDRMTGVKTIANITNNSSYSTLTAAWAARTGLVYS